MISANQLLIAQLQQPGLPGHPIKGFSPQLIAVETLQRLFCRQGIAPAFDFGRERIIMMNRASRRRETKD